MFLLPPLVQPTPPKNLPSSQHKRSNTDTTTMKVRRSKGMCLHNHIPIYPYAVLKSPRCNKSSIPPARIAVVSTEPSHIVEAGTRALISNNRNEIIAQVSCTLS